MKFFDERIQNHLINGGKIIRVSESRRIDYRPIKFIDDMLCFADKPDGYYMLSKDNLTTDDWEIVEPEYDWDKIIEDKILCLFSDNKGFKYNIFSTLRMKDNNLYYTDNGTTYKYCKPFNPAEYNIAKDVKDYEK